MGLTYITIIYCQKLNFMFSESTNQDKATENLPSATIELARIDAEELREELDEGMVTIKPKPGSSSVAHDAMTVLAVFLLSKDMLKVLSAFIARHVKRNKKSFTFDLTKPDGTKQTVTFYSDEVESASQEKILEALQKLMGGQLDPNTVSFEKINKEG